MKKNLVLTGMMGVGKSTVGKSLARKLSFKFIDIDKVIELKEGCSINLIFKKKSESYFRKLENDISLETLQENNVVISLGGGAFMNNNIVTLIFTIVVDTTVITKVSNSNSNNIIRNNVYF